MTRFYKFLIIISLLRLTGCCTPPSRHASYPSGKSIENGIEKYCSDHFKKRVEKIGCINASTDITVNVNIED